MRRNQIGALASHLIIEPRMTSMRLVSDHCAARRAHETSAYAAAQRSVHRSTHRGDSHVGGTADAGLASRLARSIDNEPTVASSEHRQLLLALLMALQRSWGAGEVPVADGKPLELSEHTRDPDAKPGRGAGCYIKGYKLHIILDV